MGEEKHIGMTHARSRKLRIASGCRCELCHEYYPLRSMEIHYLPQDNEDQEDMYRNFQDYILIVCPLCHLHIHELPVPLAEQQKRVKRRPQIVRELMRDILGCPPKIYIPPETTDLSSL
ncbi:MAG TPA: hypothetical protein VE134_03790 [Methanomicrobiales archaeon]|nr:hypothetical protein [Methanomicrobiales archaeon]